MAEYAEAEQPQGDPEDDDAEGDVHREGVGC